MKPNSELSTKVTLNIRNKSFGRKTVEKCMSGANNKYRKVVVVN